MSARSCFRTAFRSTRRATSGSATRRARDGKGDQVFKYDADGTLLMTIGTAGVDGDGAKERLHEPTDVITRPTATSSSPKGTPIGGPINRVSKWTKDGTFIKAWGKTGAAHGEFNVPHAIAFDSRGRLFVADRTNNRIQIFDQDGTFLDEWTQFGRPSGIAITRDDTIYVADSESWGPDEPGWKKGIRIGSAKDGSVKYFIEDIESTTDEHSGAEGVGVDREGNVYGVGRAADDISNSTHAEGPDVGASVDGPAARLLRRHVGRRCRGSCPICVAATSASASRASASTRSRRIQRLGQPEVEHLHACRRRAP